METLGQQLRLRRRRLGMTLDELAGKTGISKPYLSLIETGRIVNPPSDKKLKRLEQELNFSAGYLIAQAHWLKTPADVRSAVEEVITGQKPQSQAKNRKESSGIDLDQAYISGLLHELAEKRSSNVEELQTRQIPVINKVAAGYPRDFTDLDYPSGVADEYIAAPDLADPSAFAARVVGNSMSPRYQADDIVLFSPATDPKSGDDCLVRFEDLQTTFKRIYFEQSPDGAPLIRLQPRNSAYPSQTVPAARVTGIYKAIFRYQKLNGEPESEP